MEFTNVTIYAMLDDKPADRDSLSLMLRALPPAHVNKLIHPYRLFVDKVMPPEVTREININNEDKKKVRNIRDGCKLIELT